MKKVSLFILTVLLHFSACFPSSHELSFVCNCESPIMCRGVKRKEINGVIRAPFPECVSKEPSSIDELHLSRTNQEVNLDNFYRIKVLTISNSLMNNLNSGLFGELQQLIKLVLIRNEIKHIEHFTQLTNLEKLFISSNKVEIINKATFMNLCSLKLLTLEENKIYFIHADAFARNKNLVELNLNRNDLRFLEPTTFQHNTLLEEISLNYNSIKYLSPKIFSQNIKLEVLRIHGNKLKNIEMNFFKNNINLRWIELGENSLQFIDSSVFSRLANLEFIDFSFNDCIDDSFPIEMNFEHVQALIKRNCHFLALLYYDIL